MDKEIKRRKKIAKTIAYNMNLKPDVVSILSLSSRTTRKILKRMWEDGKIKCSNCAWDKCVGDLHHIRGRKIVDADNHENLSYLCPNCHRLVHNGILKKEDLISVEDYIGDGWKEYYYGYLTVKSKDDIEKERTDKEIRKKLRLTIFEERQLMVLDSKIEFDKFGWGVKLSEEFSISPQKTKKWVEKYMPEFYELNCYKKFKL